LRDAEQVTESTPQTIPADDRGLLLGDGLFETVRLYRGRPFRLERHLARLASGASTVGIPVPPELGARVAEAVASYAGEDAALRITLTRGPGDGLAPPPAARSRLIVGVRRLGGAREGPGRGFRALIRGRLEERSLVATLKATGYLERIQALRLAHGEGADEALITNSRGHVVEGSSSNLFALRDSTLFAPGPDEGALPGITREVVLEAARAMDLPVVERGLGPAELGEASEVMLSSTVRGIVPVVEIEGRRVGTGEPGPTWRALAEALSDTVTRELDL
jgi:branched-chain amino acid aminotransferase